MRCLAYLWQPFDNNKLFVSLSLLCLMTGGFFACFCAHYKPIKISFDERKTALTTHKEQRHFFQKIRQWADTKSDCNIHMRWSFDKTQKSPVCVIVLHSKKDHLALQFLRLCEQTHKKYGFLAKKIVPLFFRVKKQALSQGDGRVGFCSLYKLQIFP